MPQGVKYCVGVFEKDSIISYYERFQDGIFLKDEKGIKDSLCTYEIFDGVQAMDPIGPLTAHPLLLHEAVCRTSLLITNHCLLRQRRITTSFSCCG